MNDLSALTAQHLSELQQQIEEARQSLLKKTCRVESEHAHVIVDMNLQIVELGLKSDVSNHQLLNELKPLVNAAIRAAQEHAQQIMQAAMKGMQIDVHSAFDIAPVEPALPADAWLFKPEVIEEHLTLASRLAGDHCADINSDNFDLESLLIVHAELPWSVAEKFQAGKLRTLPVTAAGQSFPPAHQVAQLVQRSFVELPHPLCIVDWVVFMVGVIHPFLDGNRRACWRFSNLYLQAHGYKPIPWDYLRSDWESLVKTVRDPKERTAKLLDCMLASLTDE